MSTPFLSSEKRPNIAIVGGGIAGLTLTIALLTHAPTLPITLYESASAFGEIGAGVAFEPVKVRTMQLIDPRIETAFEKRSQGDRTPTDPPIWIRMRVGDKKKVIDGSQNGTVTRTASGGTIQLDEEVFNIPSRGGEPRGGVHRAHFLDELVKLMPDGLRRFVRSLSRSQRQKAVQVSDAVLHFADGTSAVHSAVLGCDGIKSKTRAIVLGDSDATSAVFSGKYAYRGLIPMTKAVEIMGPVVPKTPQMYMEYHGHVLTFPIANGTIMNVVAFSSRPEWTNEEWVVKTSREEMREEFKHWGPTVRSVMDNLQKPDIWALFDHPPASTYYRSEPLICLVGDAAHASTPYQAAGAGMCIEDAYILSQLLSQCRSKGDMKKAFAAYETVRRPRSQKLVETSREAGMLWEFKGEGVEDDIDALERNALERMAWIWDYDIGEDLDKARNAMASSS
ncbi:hypothetical protein NX059_007144 [Plenodomus lindquistii]|nr:hypothetical protein NX059_007144 [Plenodomus lindquistii]